MDGWIKIHRKLLNNPIVCKDSDYLSVWMFLLLNATHKEKHSVFGGEKILLQPGQLITGRIEISTKFNINQSKVQRILKNFEIEQQIEQQTSTKNRLISILSWSDYQNDEQQTEQQVNNKRTTTEQQVNTYKKERTKELKNKTSCRKQVYDEKSIPYRTAKYLLEHIRSHKPDLKPPDLQTWADDMRKLIEIDKREPMQIARVIEWATKDEFWQPNILSAAKLRKQWDTLTAKMAKDKTVKPEYKPDLEPTGGSDPYLEAAYAQRMG